MVLFDRSTQPAFPLLALGDARQQQERINGCRDGDCTADRKDSLRMQQIHQQ